MKIRLILFFLLASSSVNSQDIFRLNAETIYGETRDELEKKSSNKYPFNLNTVGKTCAPAQSTLKKP